jgi:hypothetical protein
MAGKQEQGQGGEGKFKGRGEEGKEGNELPELRLIVL